MGISQIVVYILVKPAISVFLFPTTVFYSSDASHCELTSPQYPLLSLLLVSSLLHSSTLTAA